MDSPHLGSTKLVFLSTRLTKPFSPGALFTFASNAVNFRGLLMLFSFLASCMNVLCFPWLSHHRSSPFLCIAKYNYVRFLTRYPLYCLLSTKRSCYIWYSSSADHFFCLRSVFLAIVSMQHIFMCNEMIAISIFFVCVYSILATYVC